MDPLSLIALAAGALFGSGAVATHPEKLVLPWVDRSRRRRAYFIAAMDDGLSIYVLDTEYGIKARFFGPRWYTQILASVVDGTRLGRSLGWARIADDSSYFALGDNTAFEHEFKHDSRVARRMVEDLHLLAVSRMDREYHERSMRALSGEARVRMDWLVEQMER